LAQVFRREWPADSPFSLETILAQSVFSKKIDVVFFTPESMRPARDEASPGNVQAYESSYLNGMARPEQSPTAPITNFQQKLEHFTRPLPSIPDLPGPYAVTAIASTLAGRL